MIGLTYKQSPSLVYYGLDAYFDFSDAQTGRLKPDLEQLKNWHSRHELPLYLKLIQQIQVLGKQTEVQPQQVCQIYAQARQSLLRISERFAPTVLDMAGSMSAEQLRFWVKKLDQRNEKWRQEWLDLSPSKLHKKRFEKNLSWAEDFYGALTTEQEKMLLTRVVQSSFDARVSYRETLRQQQEALQTLRGLSQINPAQNKLKPA
jgi:Family of unknown function (DUF6279)